MINQSELQDIAAMVMTTAAIIIPPAGLLFLIVRAATSVLNRRPQSLRETAEWQTLFVCYASLVAAAPVAIVVGVVWEELPWDVDLAVCLPVVFAAQWGGYSVLRVGEPRQTAILALVSTSIAGLLLLSVAISWRVMLP